MLSQNLRIITEQLGYIIKVTFELWPYMNLVASKKVESWQYMVFSCTVPSMTYKRINTEHKFMSDSQSNLQHSAVLLNKS